MTELLKELAACRARAAEFRKTGRWPDGWTAEENARVAAWLANRIILEISRKPAAPGTEEWLHQVNAVTWVQAVREEIEKLSPVGMLGMSEPAGG